MSKFVGESNKEFAEKDQRFRLFCSKAGIPPTARQASKFRNHHGLAWEAALNERNKTAVEELTSSP